MDVWNKRLVYLSGEILQGYIFGFHMYLRINNISITYTLGESINWSE